jgi:hypothetical protein
VPVTVPTPGEIDIDVAAFTDHDSVVDCPAVIDAGAAEKPAMVGGVGAGVGVEGGFAAAVTVTVVLPVVVPAAFWADKVYVVVAIGVTTTEFPDTVPTAGVIVTELASVTDHDSVEDSPAVTDAGDAAKLVTVGIGDTGKVVAAVVVVGGGTSTVTVVVAVVVPAEL